MKIKSIDNVVRDDEGKYVVSVLLGKGAGARRVEIPLSGASGLEFEKIESGQKEPAPIEDIIGKGVWIYKNKLLRTDTSAETATKEDILHLKLFVLRKERELEKITKQVEAFENFDATQRAGRERIPDSVRLFVWQRDEGKCVRCGRQEKLEFDHIIPVAEGGSNTERNIQLLCETCNRSKGKNI